MITWLLLGYLGFSMLTFLFVYSSLVAAARADRLQEPESLNQVALPELSQRMTAYVSAESLSLSTF